jgi:hypothetical protein
LTRPEAKGDQQIVVLIPIVIPSRWRYRILHNQIDLALSAALRTRSDVVVARVPITLHSQEHGFLGLHPPPPATTAEVNADGSGHPHEAAPDQ